MTPIVNQLDARFLGVVGLNPFAPYISASRLAMFCNHIGQSLVVTGATVKPLVTGLEREYAKAVHDIRFPCNAVILRVIPKYQTALGVDKVTENPLTSIIYENHDTPTREIGILQIPHHHCIHQHFGFNYVPTDKMELVSPGTHVKAGTVIATAPNVSPAGDLMFGLGMQVAMMSMPAVIEDGVVASKSALRRMTTKGYGSRFAAWGRNAMPLNLYGDDTIYKPFPDIGERVGENGLLFASRRHEDMLSVPLLSRRALRRLDVFDDPVYAKPNAKIVDIIMHSGRKDKSFLPTGMDEQCTYYYRRSVQYYESVLAEYNRLRREAERMGNTITVSPEFNQILVNAVAATAKPGAADRKKVVPTYGQQPIDEWLVEIVFEYDIVPTIGFKITGMAGDKGVLVDIMEDEDMPVDASGNRAELIMDADSTIKRMNVGRLYEQYINASRYATRMRLETMVRESRHAEAWEYLMGFYRTVAPLMMPSVEELYPDTVGRNTHLTSVISRGIYLFMPPNNPVSYRDVIRELRQHYPAVCGPVTYRGKSGRLVRTISDVIIGEMYIMVLEKIGNTWAGVSSAKVQHFGIPAKLNNSDKYSSPGRHNPVRGLGESEVRLVEAVCPTGTVAEILDQNNNPVAHRFCVETILTAEHPTNIRDVVDRQIVPRGQGRILVLNRHILQCGGMQFTRGENHRVNS